MHRDNIFGHKLLHVLNNMVVFEKGALALTLMHELLHDLYRLFVVPQLIRLLLVAIIIGINVQLFNNTSPGFYGHWHHLKRYVAVHTPHDIAHNLFLRLFLLVGFLQLVNRVQNKFILILLAHGLENFNRWHPFVCTIAHNIKILQCLKIG